MLDNIGNRGEKEVRMLEYNHDLRCWLRDGVVEPCEHGEGQNECYACLHAGEMVVDTIADLCALLEVAI